MCEHGDGPLSINVYMINLMAVGGVVTYSGFINRQPTMTTTTGKSNPDIFGTRTSGGGRHGELPPGQYRLLHADDNGNDRHPHESTSWTS